MSDIKQDKISQEVLEKYTIKNNSFVQIAKDNPKDLVVCEIGDTKDPTKFQNQMKICRWGDTPDENEVNVSLRLVEDEMGTAEVSTDKDKIIWKKGNIETHFYDVLGGEGGKEMEVVFLSKPKSNVIQMSVVDKGVQYFFQPELTPEEEVVGSYAIYASENKVNYVGGKEYKCGKVGHIFRPKIIDAEGNWAWEKLNIDTEKGILIITIPQDFLDKATYPIYSKGVNFGYETQGTSGYWGIQDNIRGYKATGGVGDGVSISAYIEAPDYGGGESSFCKFALYKDSDRSFVKGTQEEEFTVGGGGFGPGWKTLNFTATPTLSAIDYWICAWGDDGIGPITVAYDTAIGFGDSDIQTYGEWPDPTTIPDGTFDGKKYSIYCTYTAGGSASATPSGSPSGSPSEGTPSGSPSEGTPSGSPSEGTPSSSPSEGTPSGSPSEGTPSGSPSEATPSASPSEGTPSASPSEGTPSGSPSEATPSGSPSEATPSASPSEATPSGSPSEGTPSASPSEGTPSGSPSEGTPSGTPSEGTPSGSPSEGTPSASPSAPSQLNLQVDYWNANVGSSPSASPSEATPSGSPSEATPSASPSEGTPSGSPSEGTPSGSPSEATPSASPSEGTPSVSPSEATPSGSPSEATPSGSPSEATPSGSPSEGTPSASPSEGTPSGSPSGGTPSGSPSEATPSGSPSEGTGSASPSESTPSGSPSEGTGSASPSEGTPSASPSEGTPSASPSEGTPSASAAYPRFRYMPYRQPRTRMRF